MHDSGAQDGRCVFEQDGTAHAAMTAEGKQGCGGEGQEGTREWRREQIGENKVLTEGGRSSWRREAARAVGVISRARRGAEGNAVLLLCLCLSATRVYV